MKQEIRNPYSGSGCFFCGNDNPHGLKLGFYWDDERKEASTEYLPERRFAGQGDILHGAIQLGLLDEIMGWTCYVRTGEMAVTTGLNARFLSPVYIAGRIVRVTCRVDSEEGKRVTMTAVLTNSDGVACTTATGTYHVLPAEKYRAIIQSK